MRSPTVDWPVMYHEWARQTFIHWRYSPALLQPLVPDDLVVETFEGSAWVGLTPLLMSGVRAPAMPALPWVSEFPEINLRTYVRDARGRSGIWFLSLDAGRLLAALGGRAGYWLPYFWSEMSVRTGDGLWRYGCRRLWPEPADAHCQAVVEPGAPLTDGGKGSGKSSGQGELVRFLTARFRLFTRAAGRTGSALVEHREWPLHQGRLISLDQSLVRAAGLPQPEEEPLVHTSPGVRVRVGMWTWS